MPRALSVLALGAALIGVGCAHKRPEVEVRKLAIQGNRAVSSGEIKSRILTSGKSAWPFAAPRPFDEAIWAADLKRIDRLYETKGRYQAVVEGDIVKVSPREVDLVVRIREGEPTRVTEIAVRSVEPLDQTDKKATEKLPLKAGDVFTEPRWEETKRLLRARLRERGHAAAAASGEALLDIEDRTAKLQLTLSPGPRYRFARVTVKQEDGAKVNPAWIEEEVSSEAREGAQFSDAALEEAQRRVWQMGVFAVAKVQAGTPDPDTGLVPVIADVKEAPFRTLRLGGGAGFDQVRQEVRLIGEWTNRNFLGGLRVLRTRAVAGYAFIPGVTAVMWPPDDEAVRHGPVYTATAEFEQPRFLGAPSLRLQSGLESERQIEQAFSLLAGRGRIGVAWRPWSSFTIAPSYHLEGSRLAAAGEIPPDVVPLTLGCPGDPCFVALSYVQQGFTLDKRDNALEPRRGYLASLFLQEGGGPLGGDFDYLRTLLDGRAYIGLPNVTRLTFALRASVGMLFPRSGDPASSPVVQRFYAGGGTSMRGFNSRRLSPLLIVPVSGETPEQAPGLVALPIGGNGLLLTSFETRYRLGSVIVAGFFDSGRVTWRRPDFDDVGRMKHAVGGGLRYLTPIGPVRLDVAWRLPVGEPRQAFFEGRPLAYSENRSCFGLGGPKGSGFVKEGACVLHLSIGEAF